MRSDHDFALKLLRSFGVPSDQVRHVVLTLDIKDPPTLAVTYAAWQVGDDEWEEHTMRFTADVDLL